MFKNILIPIFNKKQKSVPQTSSEEEFKQALEIDVLARTIFGEARGEPIEGMEAVACVVMNRVRISDIKGQYWWGSGVIGVCQKPYQFSCWNRSDPSYQRLMNVTDSNIHFATCLRIARRAVIGALRDNTNGATHYHADYVSPYWAKGGQPVKTIGAHIFYKLVEA
ncbi:MAG: cell wall hydrolase [Alphaproteobacteria bacterium]|nr:cell wall hydrolase [Alphaproteobacteria bacterium]NCQ87511.1 cell wall hydrolase [Alphaproteobacteria bacterium]NCT06380.1 cell wall hydrolase [Alphaproteobacteria bacterium]